MNNDDILTSVLSVIVNDCGTGETDLGMILGEIKVVKGPLKPIGWDECITLNIPSSLRDPDTKIHSGTMMMNYYSQTYPDGNANIEKIGLVVDRLIYLFEEKWPDISGYLLIDWSVRESLESKPSKENPNEEYYSSVRVGFVVQKIN